MYGIELCKIYGIAKHVLKGKLCWYKSYESQDR